MNTKTIQELVDRYWDGETSVEEEARIRAFFAAAESLPAELEQWREWFAGKDAISLMGLPAQFDEQILVYAEKLQKQGRIVRLKRIVMSSIAVAALILGFYIFSFELNKPNQLSSADIENYELIKEMLLLTSATINRAEDTLEEGLDNLQVMNEYVNIN